jgi:sortase A
MEIGDTFCIIIHDKVLTYQVDQIKIVLPTETDDLRIESGKDYCTLLTCTPYGVNSHRLLVRGVRVDTPENVDIRVINAAVKVDPVIVASIILIPLLVLAYLIIFLFDKKRRE